MISLFFFSSCASVDLKKEKEELKVVGSLIAHRYQLKNGLKLIVVEDHSSPTFAYYTWFNVGSRHEKKGKTGLAHLFEHMMFKGTKNHETGYFDLTLKKAGVEGLNAFTSHDYTAYIQQLPAGNLDLIAQLEADRMQNLVVDQLAFKTETEVVQNERRMRNENSPDGTLQQVLFEKAFRKHSYHWPVIGYQKDLDSMNAPDAMAFYQNFYQPSRATIVVVGDVDADDVLRSVDKYYGKISSKEVVIPEIKKEPLQKKVRRSTRKLNIQVEKLTIAYKVPSVSDIQTSATLEVLQALLSDGKASRLMRALVDTGVSSSIGTGSYQGANPTLFVIHTDLQKGKRYSQAESIILKELKKLQKRKVGKAELQRAKNLVQFQFYNRLRSNSEIAHFLGQYETSIGKFEKGIEIYNSVKNVTEKDIQKIVKKYFNPNQRTVVAGVKK